MRPVKFAADIRQIGPRLCVRVSNSMADGTLKIFVEKQLLTSFGVSTMGKRILFQLDKRRLGTLTNRFGWLNGE